MILKLKKKATFIRSVSYTDLHASNFEQGEIKQPPLNKSEQTTIVFKGENSFISLGGDPENKEKKVFSVSVPIDIENDLLKMNFDLEVVFEILNWDTQILKSSKDIDPVVKKNIAKIIKEYEKIANKEIIKFLKFTRYTPHGNLLSLDNPTIKNKIM